MTYRDGAVIEYDREAHHLKAMLPSGATTALISDGGVSIKGDVTIMGNTTVQGNIKASNDITDKTRSMAADRVIYNAHTHPGVLSGPASTAPPAQPQ